MERKADRSVEEHAARQARAEALGTEITELCARRYALEARFLELLREFDAHRYWERLGFPSCAHWMNYKCSMSLHTARERVRVAHALAGLEKIRAAFAAGRLSYSKVRAMTRVADATNEDYLMNIATHGSAWHVDTLVRKTCRARKLRDAARTDGPHALRSLCCYYDGDGMLVLKARLPAEQGALVLAALERAMTAAEAEGMTVNDLPARKGQDVPAGTSVAAEGATPRREPRHARRADGLVQVAESYLAESTPVEDKPAESTRNTSSAERYRVVVHVDAATLARGSVDDPAVPDVPAGTSYLEAGPHVPAGTSRRLACDAALVGLLEDAEGIPLSVGRQTRSIPPWLRRALQARDGGCRFPGCTHTRFVDGHHIKHWADGGETSLANLVLLCRYHHRLVHEGGFGCTKTGSGEVIFTTPERERLKPYAELPGIETGEDPVAWLERYLDAVQIDTAHIDAMTCVTTSYSGDRMDWPLAVGHMFTLEEQAAASKN